MSSIDLAIVIAYVTGLFAIGIAVGRRENADDFLVLSRRAGFFLIVASVVSSWVGVGMFVGTTTSAYQTGISLGFGGAVGAAFAVLSAAIFAPRIKRFGDRYGAHTIGDFLRIRYAHRVGLAGGAVVILVYLLLAGVQFTGLASLLRVWTGAGFASTMALTAVSTVVYTAYAGIKSDFYTDAVHFVVMLGVFMGVLLPRLWNETDSFATLGSLPSTFFDPFAFGGVAYFVGGIVLGIAIVFVSMDVWQRIYAATSAATARWALATSGLIIIPFYALAVVVGLAARSLRPGLADTNLTLFIVMQDYLSTGLLGLGIAAFIALFVSSANTMMMVVSATLTKDFLAQRQRAATDAKFDMLKAGRLSTAVAGVGGLVAALFIRDIVTLSVVAIFLLLVLLPAVLGGFFWRRATAPGAFWSIVGGSLVYFAAMLWSPTNAFVPGFLVSVAVFVLVSLATKHANTETAAVIETS